jgi:hypothetical protein
MPTFTSHYDDLRALPTEQWTGPLLDELISSTTTRAAPRAEGEDWLDHEAQRIKRRVATVRQRIPNADGGILVVGISGGLRRCIGP